MNRPSKASIAVFGASAAFVLIGFGVLLYAQHLNKGQQVSEVNTGPLACEVAVLQTGQIGVLIGRRQQEN